MIKKKLLEIKHMLGFLKSDLLNIKKIKKVSRIPVDNNNISVVFLCQYIPVWNKFDSIYQEMIKHKNIKATIICIPPEVAFTAPADDTKINTTYDFFKKNKPDYNIVDALNGGNGWKDLTEFKPDYVFYTRPYNHYLPEKYRSDEVVKYSKICFLIYGMTLSRSLIDTVFNKDFVKDVYWYFAETNFAYKAFRKRTFFTSLLGYRRCDFLGMPALEEVMNSRNQSSNSWGFSKNNFRIIWTPRWTTSIEEGGSNFFEYNYKLIDLADKKPEIDFLFRPHPLSFANFVKTGEMTEKDVEDYKHEVEIRSNTSLDYEKEYTATFWESSALVTDISSIMPEYFITGKPIIFCNNNMKLSLVDHTIDMLKGCYVVNSWEEVQDRILKLYNGQDELADKRKSLIKQVFGEIEGSSARIVDNICKDGR